MGSDEGHDEARLAGCKMGGEDEYDEESVSSGGSDTAAKRAQSRMNKWSEEQVNAGRLQLACTSRGISTDANPLVQAAVLSKRLAAQAKRRLCSECFEREV